MSRQPRMERTRSERNPWPVEEMEIRPPPSRSSKAAQMRQADRLRKTYKGRNTQFL